VRVLGGAHCRREKLSRTETRSRIAGKIAAVTVSLSQAGNQLQGNNNCRHARSATPPLSSGVDNAGIVPKAGVVNAVAFLAIRRM